MKGWITWQILKVCITSLSYMYPCHSIPSSLSRSLFPLVSLSLPSSFRCYKRFTFIVFLQKKSTHTLTFSLNFSPLCLSGGKAEEEWFGGAKEDTSVTVAEIFRKVPGPDAVDNNWENPELMAYHHVVWNFFLIFLQFFFTTKKLISEIVAHCGFGAFVLFCALGERGAISEIRKKSASCRSLHSVDQNVRIQRFPVRRKYNPD